jgi:hypothetical protein
MEALTVAIIVLFAIAGLAGFGLLALRFGVDSRGTIGDDHARSIGF